MSLACLPVCLPVVFVGNICADEDCGCAACCSYNVVHAASTPPPALPLVGQFVSTLLCVGHVKSTATDDAAFFDEFSTSSKWLAMAE